MCNNASSGHHSSTAYGDIGKDDGSWSNECALLNPDSTRLFEMRNKSDTHADETVIGNGNEFWAGRVNNNVTANQHILSDIHAARPMQPYPQRTRSWRKESHLLQYAIYNPPERILALLIFIVA